MRQTEAQRGGKFLLGVFVFACQLLLILDGMDDMNSECNIRGREGRHRRFPPRSCIDSSVSLGQERRSQDGAGGEQWQSGLLNYLTELLYCLTDNVTNLYITVSLSRMFLLGSCLRDCDVIPPNLLRTSSTVSNCVQIPPQQ